MAVMRPVAALHGLFAVSALLAAGCAVPVEVRYEDPDGRHYLWVEPADHEFLSKHPNTRYTLVETGPGLGRLSEEEVDSIRHGSAPARPGDRIILGGEIPEEIRWACVSPSGGGFLAGIASGDAPGSRKLMIVTAARREPLYTAWPDGLPFEMDSDPGKPNCWYRDSAQEALIGWGSRRLFAVDLVNGRLREGDERDILFLLSQRDPLARRSAVEFAGLMRASAARPLIAAELNDPMQPLAHRIRCAVSLHQLGNDAGVPLVVQVASRAQETGKDEDGYDPDYDLAVSSLRELLGDKATPILRGIVERDPDMEAAWSGLAASGDGAVPELEAIIGGARSDEIANGAAAALAGIESGPARNKLLALCSDARPRVRSAALSAAAATRDPRFAPAILAGREAGACELSPFFEYFGSVNYPPALERLEWERSRLAPDAGEDGKNRLDAAIAFQRRAK